MEEEEIVELVKKIGARLMDIDMDLISDDQLKEIIHMVNKEEENEEE